MSEWTIGARYVCPRCHLRGWTLGCPRCTQPRADIAHAEGLTRLQREWPEARAWRAGRSFFSPWTIRSAGRVCALAAVLALVGWVGAPLLAYQRAHDLVDALATLAVGVIFLPFTFAIYALVVFYFAHALRLLALVYALLGALFFPFSLVAGLLERAARVLLPRVELDAVRSRETAVRGTAVLSEPLRIHRLVDEGGWMTRRDAHLPAVRITLDGRDLSLEVSAGSIALPIASGTRENAASPAAPSYREAAALELPAHIDGLGRGRSSQRTLPEGTQLLLRGGSLEGDVLRGAKHAPLWIEVL